MTYISDSKASDTLLGKIIVVTGGAGLLGRRFCAAIAMNGGVAVLADVDATAAAQAAADIGRDYPNRIESTVMDITDKTSVTTAIKELNRRYGRIDAVVNNAYPRNHNYGRNLEEVTYEDFCNNVSTHLGGYFLVAQQFGMFFRQQGYGNIINMASIYGIVAPRFGIYEGTSITMPVEYAAVKSAIIHLTRYFARYFRGGGIRVNSLSPGGILDAQPPVFLERYNAQCNDKGMLDGGDVVGSLIFLLSDASRFVTGHNLIVDDGFSL